MLPSEPHQYVAGAEDAILRCPWHGWEFSLDTGRSIFDPDNVRVKAYAVAVVDGAVIVEVP
jgi:3-phenylpropionate/trans-cinnamate dioxygenase ferredoxin subunit